MTRLILPAMILGLSGCSKDSDTADTAAGDASCGVEVDETFPAANATDAYYRSAIEFHLSDPDPSAVITVDGVDGTSSLNEDSDVVTFTPSSPLAASTSYTATLTYCTGDASIDFSTSELGGAVDSSSIVGNAYSLDLSTGRIVIPEGVGSILSAYLEYTLLIGIDSADASTLVMTGAVADEDDPSHQDYCSPTLVLPEADFSQAPYFQVGPSTTTIEVDGLEITIDDLYISGTVSPDGSWFGGGELAGFIDTRPLATLLGEDGGDDAICSLVAGFGVECIPCSDGEPYCLELLAVDLLAEGADTVVESIDMEDCHEQCDASSSNKECTL